MKSIELMEAMNGIEREDVWKTGQMLGLNPTGKRRAARRTMRTLLLAAAITALLGATAYAVGSIHQTRQRELREDLGIEQVQPESYVEYQAPETEGEGVVLLSTVNDGEEQRVYVNVSPVTAEDLVGFPGKTSFGWRIAGTELGGFAGPQLPASLTLRGYDEIHKAVMDYAYDAETKTLTLECCLNSSALNKTMEALGRELVPLELLMRRENGETVSFGSVDFAPTAEEKRSFDFGHAVYHDEESGKDIEILGLDLTPFGAVWKLCYDEAEAIHQPHDPMLPDEQVWSMLEDKVCIDAKLHFSDGSTFSTGGALTCPFIDGAVHETCGWGSAIDIYDVQRITLGNLVLWEVGR